MVHLKPNVDSFTFAMAMITFVLSSLKRSGFVAMLFGGL